MQIKVFKASNMKEAVTKMKAELGDDAVILHTKKYKEGGILGYGSKEMVEVTAAIEDEKPAVKNEPEKPSMPTIAVNPPSVLSQYKTNGTAEGLALAEKESVPRPSLSDSEKTTDIKSQKPTLMRPTLNPNVKNQASPLKEAMMPNAKSELVDTSAKMPYEKESAMPYEAAESKDEKVEQSVEDSKASAPSINIGVETKKSNDETKDKDNSEPINAESVESQNVNTTTNTQPYNISPAATANEEAVPASSPVANAIPANDTSLQSAQQEQTLQSTASDQTSVQVPQQSVPLSQTQQSIPNQVQQNTDIQVPITQQNQLVQSATTLVNPISAPVNQAVSMQVNSTDTTQQIPTNQPMPIQNVPNTQPVQDSFSVQQVSNQPQNSPQMQNLVDSAVNSAVNASQVDMTQPLTPAQLAQAQAMMMAQFNQMQMAQAMQQAMAQAQASQQYQPQTSPPIQPVVETSDNERQSQEKIQRLESEIAQMKALLAQVIGKDTNRGTVSLHEALKRQEVDEDILNDMASHAGAGETLSDSQSREAKSTLVKFLKENINFSEGIKLNRHGVRIAALLGTTGVGKTTTLAKIAAKFVLEQGITAALITADTYRISAVEQLRTYSDILGLPLEIVYSPIELSKAINKYRNRDLILIDTAGRSQHNDYQMKELQEFLRTNQRIEKHIVLSTTTKSSDANDILEKFSICEPDKIIFTKTDETASTGLILNLLYKQKLSLSYLTNGQSVPDDIIPANEEALADLLLRRNVNV